jgi:SpoVK/Ycf46/Vps4 family AAA+-type ATPase
MSSLYLTNLAPIQLEDVVFEPKIEAQINELIAEYDAAEELAKYGLPIANKIFMHGATGCGKTMTARALAQRLHKKIFIVNLSSIVSSKLGETAKNLAALFNSVQYKKAILFFDEFDSLGRIRDYENSDSSEMKRIVNTILQLMDSFPADSMLIAATNQIKLIDHALLRRFDMKIEFNNPANAVLDSYYDKLLAEYPKEFHNIDRVYNISYAEAKTIVISNIKQQIIQQKQTKK